MPAPRKPDRPRQPKPVEEAKRRLTEPKGPKRWGKVARRGAGTLDEDEATASAAWRDAMDKARKRDTGPPQRDEVVWRREEPKK